MASSCSLDALKQCGDFHLQFSMGVICSGTDQVSCLDCLLGGLQILQEHSVRLGRNYMRNDDLMKRLLLHIVSSNITNTYSPQHKGAMFPDYRVAM